MQTPGAASNRLAIFFTTALTGVVLLWASFYPTHRVWGLSVWAYLDVWIRVLLFGLMVLTAAIILWKRDLASQRESPGTGPSWGLLALAVGAGVLFYLFRTQVHFLGDGYLLLKSLTSDNPLLRSRNYGELLIHKWIKNALPLQPEAAALASFRIVSIGAGVAHAVLVAWLAPRMVGHRIQGWLFALAMMTGGYALMYFGYVENYSMFGLAVASYTYLGILISMGLTPRWWIIPTLASAVFFHALGLTLVLPTVYLLTAGTVVSKKWGRLRFVGKASAVTLGLVMLVLVAYAMIQRSLFLEFSLVPPQGHVRVLEGYSMFSLPHFADFGNLLFMLSPASLILMATLMKRGENGMIADPRIRFLTVMAAAVFAGAFVFEAKIGMPRDWDLFSFVGYPWMALLLLAVIAASSSERANCAMSAAVAVGVFCLVPRVLTARTPDRGIQQFRDYADIDIRKNRSGWYVLRQYYVERADSSASRAVENLRAKRFPEESIMHAADDALVRAQIDSAMRLDRMAIDINPTLAGCWTNLGVCHVSKRQDDSAIFALRISNALNPDAPLAATLLGLAYYRTGQVDEAEDALLEAHRLDSTTFEPVMALARLYQERGENDEYVHWLIKAAHHKKAKGEYSTELGEAYLQRADLENAARAFQVALDKGADSLKILQRLDSQPDLKFYFGR